MKPILVENIEAVKAQFPLPMKRPEWLKHYLLLIKTKRGGKYYIVEGLSYEGMFRVRGFDKFKVIGYCEQDAELLVKNFRA